MIPVTDVQVLVAGLLGDAGGAGLAPAARVDGRAFAVTWLRPPQQGIGYGDGGSKPG